MKTMDPKDIFNNGQPLSTILENHKHWISKDIDGWKNMRANLRGAFLRRADLIEDDLRGADLSRADLTGADLSRADLTGARLTRADLSFASLTGARLTGADLINANLNGADLSFASLNGADLTGARLTGARLIHANLKSAKGCCIEYRKGKILSEDIIGYKKCKHDVIVTLKIPRGAIVFSINGTKCRTNKAEVIAIDGADRAYSLYNQSIAHYMSYYLGDKITVYDFNCEYNIECEKGIHFFMSKEDAVQYSLF